MRAAEKPAEAKNAESWTLPFLKNCSKWRTRSTPGPADAVAEFLQDSKEGNA